MEHQGFVLYMQQISYGTWEKIWKNRKAFYIVAGGMAGEIGYLLLCMNGWKGINIIVSKILRKLLKRADKAETYGVYNYPYAALEEALANAVYHRAYDIREPIEVRVRKGMIEIVSFPGPDRSVTKEGLKRYKVSNRRYRNRRIGEILKELHLTEGRNTGFGKILRALEENGSPKPEFETDE